MAEVAKAHDVVFVDLFTPSLRLYAEQQGAAHDQRHPPERRGQPADRARSIDRALFGDAPKHAGRRYLTKLRQAVVDKNFHWFHRYRVTDGYSTYGDRAFLTFVRGNPRNVNANSRRKTPKEDVLPTNYDVLQRELPILDVMTANRDRRIWAVARGGGR